MTAPPGGYTLDAVATEGRITIEDGDVKPSEGNDPRATGPVRGGGPTLTLRVDARKHHGPEACGQVT